MVVRCGCEGGSKTVVRKLAPTECERLQGFPDGYTKVPYKGKPAEIQGTGKLYGRTCNASKWMTIDD